MLAQTLGEQPAKQIAVVAADVDPADIAELVDRTCEAAEDVETADKHRAAASLVIAAAGLPMQPGDASTDQLQQLLSGEILRATNKSELKLLEEAVVALREKLSPEQALAFQATLLQAITERQQDRNVGLLQRALYATTGGLDEPAQQTAWSNLLTRTGKLDESPGRQVAAEGLRVATGLLAPNDLPMVLKELQSPRNTEVRVALARGLWVLAARHSDEIKPQIEAMLPDAKNDQIRGYFEKALAAQPIYERGTPDARLDAELKRGERLEKLREFTHPPSMTYELGRIAKEGGPLTEA